MKTEDQSTRGWRKGGCIFHVAKTSRLLLKTKPLGPLEVTQSVDY